MRSKDELDTNGSISLTESVNWDMPGGVEEDEDELLNDENSTSYNGLSRVPIMLK